MEVKQILSSCAFQPHEDLVQSTPIDRSVILSNKEPSRATGANSAYEISENLVNFRESFGRSSSSLNRFLQTLPKGLGWQRQQNIPEDHETMSKFKPRWRFETIARIVWRIKNVRRRIHSRKNLVRHRTTVKNTLLVENREEGRETKRYMNVVHCHPQGFNTIDMRLANA